ncbi:MAG: hypothetical protein KGM16_04025 [Bacteroidota bacterium]|nr:hypothetical protein [Bacteroidota bacterium]
MKKFLFVGLLFFAKTTFANTPSIGEVRSLYEKAVNDESACNKLVEILSPYNENNNPLYAGYKASAIMMMAKHVINPFSKMSYFKKGKRILENAIKADENNIELRFLRFNAQTHMPSFLGYNGDIKKDKAFLEDSFSKITDVKLKEFMLPYLKNSDFMIADTTEQMKK